MSKSRGVRSFPHKQVPGKGQGASNHKPFMATMIAVNFILAVVISVVQFVCLIQIQDLKEATNSLSTRLDSVQTSVKPVLSLNHSKLLRDSLALDSIYYSAYDKGFNEALTVKYDAYDAEIEMYKKELKQMEEMLQFLDTPQKISSK